MFNLNETLLANGLDYTVETFHVKHPITGENTKFFGTYNSSNGEVFNTNFVNYTTIQNRDAFRVLEDVASYLPEMTVSKAGVFDGGKTAFISLNIGEDSIGGNSQDKLQKELTIYNSHDGSSPILLSTGSFRVLCKNQLHNIFAKSFAKFSHTKTGTIKYDRRAVGIILENFQENYRSNFELYNRLARTKISKAHILASISKLLLKDKTEFTKNAVTILEKRVDTIMSNLRSADGGTIEVDTGWNLFNSIQGMYQHSPYKEPEDYTKSTMVGAIKGQTLETLRVVDEVCQSPVESFEDLLLQEEIKALTESFDFAF